MSQTFPDQTAAAVPIVQSPSVLLAGSKLVVRCMGSKSSEVELEHSFKARQWCHVSLTLSCGSALTPGWARLYVDGLLEASERFKYPKVRCITDIAGLTTPLADTLPMTVAKSASDGPVTYVYKFCTGSCTRACLQHQALLVLTESEGRLCWADATAGHASRGWQRLGFILFDLRFTDMRPAGV